MRSGSVEIVHIRVEHAVELFLMQDEQMIKALTSHTAQEPLTVGIGSRGVIRGLEKLDMTCSSQPRETHSKLAIVITDEVFRTLCWLPLTSVLKRDHIHPRTSQVRSIFSPFLPSTSQPCLVLTRFTHPRTGSAEHQPLEIDMLSA
jgi:hypothetical protein